jgi:hypothetical protein
MPGISISGSFRNSENFREVTRMSIHCYGREWDGLYFRPLCKFFSMMRRAGEMMDGKPFWELAAFGIVDDVVRIDGIPLVSDEGKPRNMLTTNGERWKANSRHCMRSTLCRKRILRALHAVVSWSIVQPFPGTSC